MPDDTSIFHKLTRINNTCWSVDYGYGRVFKSLDAGQSWRLQYQTSGEYLEAIQFLNEDIGYLCGDYGIIMKTIDGGESWREVGPSYSPRITRSNAMEGDSNAIKRYYYQMHFKDVHQGLVWGFEVNPALGWRSQSSFFYKTEDGGDSWEKIEYGRGAFDGVVESFLQDAHWEESSALGLYQRQGQWYKIGRQALLKQANDHSGWLSYPHPQMPDDRFMLRTMHFINKYQGYVLGGNFHENSMAYILETLDGGASWRQMDTDLPHIHYSLQTGGSILMSGKDGLLQHWTPKVKSDSSFIHQGNASRILIDGQIDQGEWRGANRTMITDGIDLYTLADEHYLYLSVHYDTSQYVRYYCDLYVDLGNDTLLNLHASQQRGERLLSGTEWTESAPAFRWGHTSSWISNTIDFDRREKQYLPYKAMEFQIARSKLTADRLSLALKTRDLNGEREVVQLPDLGRQKHNMHWKVFYLP